MREYVAAVFDDVRGRSLAAKERYARLWDKYPADAYFGYLVARAEVRADAPHDAEATLLELTRRSGEGALEAETEASVVATTRDPIRLEGTANRLLEVAKSTGSSRLEARARRLLGTVAETRGDASLAMSHFQAAEKLYLERGEPVTASDVTDDIAHVCRTQGRSAEAIRLHQSVLATKRAAGHSRGVCSTLINLGSAYHLLGRFNEAERAWAEGLTVAETRGYQSKQVALLNNLAATKFSVEDFGAASTLYRRAIDKASATSHHQGEVYALEGQFDLTLVRGRFNEAQEFLTRATSLVEAFRIVSREDSIVQRQAMLAYARGERARFEAFCATTLPKVRPTHDQERLGQWLPRCAMATAVRGDAGEGLRLVEEAKGTVKSLEPSNPRRDAISRAEAFVAYLVGDFPRCLRTAHEGALGTEPLGMNGPSTELRVMAALARDAMGDSVGASEELVAATRWANRSVDPRALFRARAAAAILSGDAGRLAKELRATSTAGFIGVADELRALAHSRAAHRKKR